MAPLHSDNAVSLTGHLWASSEQTRIEFLAGRELRRSDGDPGQHVQRRKWLNIRNLIARFVPRNPLPEENQSMENQENEVCIYKVKPDKAEEFEHLIERVVKHHRGLPGV